MARGGAAPSLDDQVGTVGYLTHVGRRRYRGDRGVACVGLDLPDLDALFQVRADALDGTT